MSNIEHVKEELECALNTFTAEGFAEAIGFDAGPGGIVAEVYGTHGDIEERFAITFTIEPISKEA